MSTSGDELLVHRAGLLCRPACWVKLGSKNTAPPARARARSSVASPPDTPLRTDGRRDPGDEKEPCPTDDRRPVDLLRLQAGRRSWRGRTARPTPGAPLLQKARPHLASEYRPRRYVVGEHAVFAALQAEYRPRVAGRQKRDPDRPQPLLGPRRRHPTAVFSSAPRLHLQLGHRHPAVAEAGDRDAPWPRQLTRWNGHSSAGQCTPRHPRGQRYAVACSCATPPVLPAGGPLRRPLGGRDVRLQGVNLGDWLVGAPRPTCALSSLRGLRPQPGWRFSHVRPPADIPPAGHPGVALDGALVAAVRHGLRCVLALRLDRRAPALLAAPEAWRGLIERWAALARRCHDALSSVLRSARLPDGPRSSPVRGGPGPIPSPGDLALGPPPAPSPARPARRGAGGLPGRPAWAPGSSKLTDAIAPTTIATPSSSSRTGQPGRRSPPPPNA